MQKLNFNKAKNLKALSGMPQMGMTLNGWEVPLTLVKVFQDIVEGDLVTTEQEISFMGVIQPFNAERLQSLPEGWRSWQWWWIHCKAGSLNLNTADKIIYNGRRYKIMAVKDYSANSFIEYEIILDYQDKNSENN